MTQSTFLEYLQTGLKKLAISDLPPEAGGQLHEYFLQLKKWNQKINLVAKTTDQELIENHFIDSLSLLPLITKYGKILTPTLLDVGTGAGFPGLVLKIAHPELAITLLEPRQKRVAFLKNIARSLSLKNITIACQRLDKTDNVFHKEYGRFPMITSRAFNEIEPFLAMVNNTCTGGGVVLCMKGPKAPEEIRYWQEKEANSPFTITEQRSLALPYSKAKRQLVVFKRKFDDV